VTTAIVAAETVLLALLALFVVALLRSHAEILRRLEALDPGERVPSPRSAGGARAAPGVTGATPSGGAAHVSVESGETVLAFLSSGCASCGRLLDTISEGVAALAPARLVVVAKSPDAERPRRFRPLEPHVEVVMSTAAWDGYGVPGSPYFVHVDGGAVAGEGSATAWAQVASLLADAAAEQDDADVSPRVDAALAAAGIEPGHPSLHPSREAAGG
jgi:hypothetical protein